MISKITGGPTDLLFTAKVLGKYDVSYHACRQTGFVQTEDPYWLEEAYSDAITALDLGIISRNFEKAELTSAVISTSLPDATSFVDYGGGYGIFTRLMRDKGYDFTHYDTHCENLFARDFDTKELVVHAGVNYDLLTAWEVFEHLVDPVRSLTEMLDVADAVLFSTELVPALTIRSPKDWWYFTPETGQHVSFYTKAALQYLATQLSLHFYTDGICNHVLSKAAAVSNPFSKRSAPTLLSRLQDQLTRKAEPTSRDRPSLLTKDFQQALSRVKAGFVSSNARTD